MADPTASPEVLIETARRAIQRGELTRARAVVRLLTDQYPHDRRVWDLRADVAADDTERQLVLERLAALRPTEPELPEPTNEPLGLPTRTTAVALTPTETLQHQPRRPSWPTMLVVGLAALIVLGLITWRWGGIAALGGTPTQPSIPTPEVLPTSIRAAATLLPTRNTVQPSDPTAAPLEAATSAPTTPLATDVPALPSPQPTNPPRPTARPTLPIGQVVQTGNWTITLLRPEHTMILDGSIGTLQPHGRFVLALLAIGNTGTQPAALPEGLITLIDERGNRYRPTPGVSGAYLNAYGRGQAGDISLDEPIPADTGNLSVPILFDIPLDAHGLQVVVADGTLGWAVPEGPNNGQ
jgi:hypothetical protein